MQTVRKKAYVILDGTVLPVPRLDSCHRRKRPVTLAGWVTTTVLRLPPGLPDDVSVPAP